MVIQYHVTNEHVNALLVSDRKAKLVGIACLQGTPISLDRQV